MTPDETIAQPISEIDRLKAAYPERISSEELLRMAVCRHLLPAPGAEPVGALIADLARERELTHKVAGNANTLNDEKNAEKARADALEKELAEQRLRDAKFLGKHVTELLARAESAESRLTAMRTALQCYENCVVAGGLFVAREALAKDRAGTADAGMQVMSIDTDQATSPEFVSSRSMEQHLSNHIAKSQDDLIKSAITRCIGGGWTTEEILKRVTRLEGTGSWIWCLDGKAIIEIWPPSITPEVDGHVMKTRASIAYRFFS